jgi:hypothetical protein
MDAPPSHQEKSHHVCIQLLLGVARLSDPKARPAWPQQ